MAKYSNPGSRMRAVYQATTTSPLCVVKVGEEDQFKLIQASKESVLLDNLVARALDGDISALDQTHGMYGDFSEVPDNLADVLKAYNRGIAAYDALPRSVRETYGSIGDLLDAIASGEFDSSLSPSDSRVENNAEREVENE